MKKFYLLLILCFIILLYNKNTIAYSRVYSLSTIITALDVENDIVTCKDFNGNEWNFQGVEDWFIGDICSLTMDNKNTANITDDVIISTKYCGFILDK